MFNPASNIRFYLFTVLKRELAEHLCTLCAGGVCLTDKVCLYFIVTDIDCHMLLVAGKWY